MLENEAIRRAYHGVEEPITVAGKREIIHEYSIPADIAAQGCPTTEITR
jgi:hypothetical protein